MHCLHPPAAPLPPLFYAALPPAVLASLLTATPQEDYSNFV